MARRTRRDTRSKFRSPGFKSSGRSVFAIRASQTSRRLPRIASYAPAPLRRREPPAFIPTRLRSLVVSRGSADPRSQQGNIVNRIRFSRAHLVNQVDSPCDRQHTRREVMFANKNAGAAWGRGRGPFPKSMREKISHGCTRGA